MPVRFLPEYHQVVTIPPGARSIRVHETSVSTCYIAVHNAHQAYYLNGRWTVDRPGRYAFSGTTFDYRRSHGQPESLTSAGPTNETLVVEVGSASWFRGAGIRGVPAFLRAQGCRRGVQCLEARLHLDDASETRPILHRLNAAAASVTSRVLVQFPCRPFFTHLPLSLSDVAVRGSHAQGCVCACIWGDVGIPLGPEGQDSGEHTAAKPRRAGTSPRVPQVPSACFPPTPQRLT